MPPVENRADSYARAARAASMRGTGATWQQIADREGYRSRRAAQLAVQRHQQREAGNTLAHRRYDADEGYRIVQQTLFTEMADARRRGDHQGVIASARAITDTLDKRVRLHGLHVPVAQQVDVSVSADPAAIIARAEADLLALVEQRQLPGTIIDAEVEEITR